MAQATIPVYLEIGTKRVIAGAVDWPGWCRAGRDEAAALQALLDAAPRYARVVEPAGLGFVAPAGPAALDAVERLVGNATTDFGAPDVALAADARPLDAGDVERYRALLLACWAALDGALRAAEGQELRRGPRGGGRTQEGIVRHVLEAEQAYLGRLGWRRPRDGGDPAAELAQTRQAVLATLAAAAGGELPERGPRGGARWSPHFFVRRAAWHILDHAWEIEDRSQ